MSVRHIQDKSTEVVCPSRAIGMGGGQTDEFVREFNELSVRQ